MNELNGYEIEDLTMSATFAKTITEAHSSCSPSRPGTTTRSRSTSSSPGARVRRPYCAWLPDGQYDLGGRRQQVAGPGTVYMSQQMNFRAPVKPGKTVHATVTVTEIIGQGAGEAATVCRFGDTVVVDGEALVKVASANRRR